MGAVTWARVPISSSRILWLVPPDAPNTRLIMRKANRPTHPPPPPPRQAVKRCRRGMGAQHSACYPAPVKSQQKSRHRHGIEILQDIKAIAISMYVNLHVLTPPRLDVGLSVARMVSGVHV